MIKTVLITDKTEFGYDHENNLNSNKFYSLVFYKQVSLDTLVWIEWSRGSQIKHVVGSPQYSFGIILVHSSKFSINWTDSNVMNICRLIFKFIYLVSEVSDTTFWDTIREKIFLGIIKSLFEPISLIFMEFNVIWHKRNSYVVRSSFTDILLTKPIFMLFIRDTETS